MDEAIDWSHYKGLFHDGSLISIERVGDELILLMTSAEILPRWNVQSLNLTKANELRGKLHCKGVREIKVGGKKVGQLEMNHDYGCIFDLDVDKHTVELFVNWVDLSPKPPTNDCSDVRIEADQIFWKNDPSLIDPYSA